MWSTYNREPSVGVEVENGVRMPSEADKLAFIEYTSGLNFVDLVDHLLPGLGPAADSLGFNCRRVRLKLQRMFRFCDNKFSVHHRETHLPLASADSIAYLTLGAKGACWWS